MRMAVNMEKKWGDYKIDQYSISVSRDAKQVWLSFRNQQKDAIQTGGFLSLPADVANRLGHALLLLSSGKAAGFSDEGVTFRIDETTHDHS